jgi:hypothetical protein
MGAGLVALALAQPDISDRARAVLARMCLVALDSDDPPVYWAGWPMLGTHGLGRQTYDTAAVRAVTRAIRELLDTGLIKAERPAGPGRNTEYTIHLRPR